MPLFDITEKGMETQDSMEFSFFNEEELGRLGFPSGSFLIEFEILTHLIESDIPLTDEQLRRLIVRRGISSSNVNESLRAVENTGRIRRLENMG